MSRRQAPRWDWVLSGPGTGRSGWGSEGDLQEAITACGEHKSGGRGQPLIPGCRSPIGTHSHADERALLVGEGP